MSQSQDDLTPPSTDLSAWQAGNPEAAEHRDLLGHLLTDARVALAKALGEVDALAALQDDAASNTVGHAAALTIQGMLVTLAGVRAITMGESR